MADDRPLGEDDAADVTADAVPEASAALERRPRRVEPLGRPRFLWPLMGGAEDIPPTPLLRPALPDVGAEEETINASKFNV